MTCASCGRENPEANRFCGQCAAPLETAARAESEDRRVVTIVFADLEGSTALGERLDPEALRDVQSRYFAAMRGPLIAHGGTIEKYIGDAVMAVFGIPALHEDDALRAVRAAIEMQDAMAELNRELERDLGVGIALRIGVNTGEVAGIDGGLIAGDAVNTAARLQAVAPAGGVVIGRHTRRLVESSVRLRALGRVVVKGKARPLPIWQVDSLVETAGSTVRGALVPLVGRRIELRMLNTRFARAVERQRCVLVTVSGPAGIGKSRLLKEFAAAVDPRAAVAVGRCLPYGEGITYWPLIEIVNSLTGNAGSAGLTDLLADDPQRQVVASRLAAVVGGRSGAATEQDVQWGITRLFDALARRGPLVIMFDDIHWAEQAMLDLVEHVSEHSSAPVLIVCSAREELFERRPQWARAGGRASVIRLEPLSDREVCQLLRRLAVRRGASVRRGEAIETAGGNPLFMEQIVAMRADDPAIRVPPTVQALLAARIDALPADERRVIEAAAVEGRGFHRGAVATLVGGPTAVDTALASLVGRQLIHRDTSEFAHEIGYRFAHILVRDAALVRSFVRARLSYRFVETESGEAAYRIERLVQAGELAGVGKPLLNPR